MELKNYQRAVIRDLERYLEILMQTGSIETAYRRLWEEKHVPVGPGGMPRYQDLLPGVANVCLKVPTGGGKTFLALAQLPHPIYYHRQRIEGGLGLPLCLHQLLLSGCFL